MKLDLTQCDACQCTAPADMARNFGWITFSGCFLLPNGDVDNLRSVRVDLCPRCATRMAAMLQLAMSPTDPTTDIQLESIDTVEQRHILNVLNAVGWVKTRASQILGIERSTLDRKIKQYGAMPPGTTKTAVPELATA